MDPTYSAGAMVVGGLVLLTVGADWLVRGAASLAKRLNVREIVIGLTVVAFGTSMPEMVVSIFASAEGRNDIVFGNVLGSNVFNTLMILGLAGLIRPLAVQRNTTWKEIPFSILVTLVLFLLVNGPMLGGPAGPESLSRSEGLVLLVMFAMFLSYTWSIARQEPTAPEEMEVRVFSLSWSLILLAVGLGGLVGGGKLCVDGAVALAQRFGLSEKFIGCTIVAAGTSLPELATSVVAAIRKRSDIAIGNVVGSNIFNILCILGLSTAIRPAPYNPLFNVDFAILTAGSLLLFGAMFSGGRHRLDRWEAALLLAGYGGYTAWLLSAR